MIDAIEYNPSWTYCPHIDNPIEIRNTGDLINKESNVEPLENPTYYLSIIAIFRDEARFLKEWVEFYKLMGVEHFYLYNHLSKDNPQAILKPYIDQGIVELTNLNHEPLNATDWYKNVQYKTYNEAIKITANITEWLIVVDSDEFLFPVKENNLTNVLKAYDNYASLAVNWKIFGSNNVSKIESDQLMIEKLVMKESTPNLHVKNIVKPRYIEKFTNPHFAILKPGYTQITENYQIFKGPFSPCTSTNILAINHYRTRDLEFFEETKLSRVHLVNKKLNEEAKKRKISELIDYNEPLAKLQLC